LEENRDFDQCQGGIIDQNAGVERLGFCQSSVSNMETRILYLKVRHDILGGNDPYMSTHSIFCLYKIQLASLPPRRSLSKRTETNRHSRPNSKNLNHNISAPINVHFQEFLPAQHHYKIIKTKRMNNCKPRNKPQRHHCSREHASNDEYSQDGRELGLRIERGVWDW
jgi:hypothetical protein